MKGKTLLIATGLLLSAAALSGRNYNNAGKTKSILFLGDSNTFYDFSYAHSFKSKFPNTRVKIIAKIGAQTSWMLNELKKELSVNKYDVISVLGGSNDIYASNSNASALKNLDAIYDLAKSKGMKIIAIAPPNKNFFIRKTEKKQQELFSLIKWIMSNKKKDYFINFWNITDNKKFFNSDDGYLHAQKPAHDILLLNFLSTVNL